MKWLSRFINRSAFIFRVAGALGANLPSKLKMVGGGLWLLINDSWKSRLRFTAQIRYEGSILPFIFEDASDFELFDEIFLNASYYFTAPLEEDAVIVDLGANIGVSSLFFSMKWPAATIHSVEPDPENFRRLTEMASHHQNQKLHHYAVWSESGKIQFFSDRRRGSSSSVHPDGSNREAIEIDAISLRDLLEQIGVKKVSILKFDVEGAEEEIFRSFSDFKRIERLAGELHHDLCNTEPFLMKIKQEYNKVELHPLKEKRDYLIALNQVGKS